MSILKKKKKRQQNERPISLIYIRYNKHKYFQNNATLSKFTVLLNYLSYGTKGNKVKLYICS